MPYATREKRSRYMRDRYQRKKEELKDYQRSNRNLFNKIRLLHLKGVTKCEGCDEDHPAVLQFHHRDPSSKVKSVMQLVGSNASWEILKTEVEKCDVLCSNCHKLEHNNWTDGQIKKTRQMVLQGEVAINRREYKLTSDMEEAIRSSYLGGKTIQEVANDYDVNKSTMYSYMIKYNIPRRSQGLQISKVYFKDEDSQEISSEDT